MSEGEGARAQRRDGRLHEAIRSVKIAAAERDDVVVELREATRMRLELLAQELEPVFADVPPDDIMFDFVISAGTQPRLWIDAISHVAMGRDRRTYRFLRDTRLGRTVLAESGDIRPIADAVTRYIAERLIERQRWLDGDIAPAAPSRGHHASSQTPAAATDERSSASAPSGRPKRAEAVRSFVSGLGIVLGGAAVGLAVIAAIYWDRVAAWLATLPASP